jgi:hypothetical protein
VVLGPVSTDVTAGGPGEPKGNGAASRFPFPLTGSDCSEAKAKVNGFAKKFCPGSLAGYNHPTLFWHKRL